MPRFAAITRFAETLNQPGIDDASEHFQAIQFRTALDDAMPALIQTGFSYQLRRLNNLRKKILKETYFNIIYRILTGLVLTIFLIIGLISVRWVNNIASFLCFLSYVIFYSPY